jgi:hypothetical protein
MATLEPCPGCQRHVKTDASSCPFCAADLSVAFANLPARAVPRTRLGRAALFAFGVSAAATPLINSCSSSHNDDDNDGKQHGDAGKTDGGKSPDKDGGGGVAPLYGLAPVDAGNPVEDAGMPQQWDDGGGPVALYGAAPSDEA